MSALGRERPPTLVGPRSPLSDTSCQHSSHRHSQQRFIGPRRLARRLGKWNGGSPLTLGSSHDSAIHVAPCSLRKNAASASGRNSEYDSFWQKNTFQKIAEKLQMWASSTNPLVWQLRVQTKEPKQRGKSIYLATQLQRKHELQVYPRGQIRRSTWNQRIWYNASAILENIYFYPYSNTCNNFLTIF